MYASAIIRCAIWIELTAFSTSSLKGATILLQPHPAGIIKADLWRRLRCLLLCNPDSWIRVLANMIEQEIREGPDFGRQPDAVLVGDVHREQRQFPVRQDWHELA